MPDPDKRYWGSSVFLALIKNEAGRADVCESIVGDARAGHSVIFTSMLTLVEVVKRRAGSADLDARIEDTIASFFRNDFIKLVPIDHTVATRARRLIWDFPWLGARDAIHLATAMQLGVPVVEHYDDDDIGRVGNRIADECLTGFPEIRHPKWVGQAELELGPMTAPAATEATAERATFETPEPPSPARTDPEAER